MRLTLTTILALLIGQAYCQSYTLQGDAVFLGNDCYRLTTELGFQNGAVWYEENIDLNEAFDIQFLMNFGDIDGNGADGICFVLQTVGNNALGDSGGGLGFLGFSPAFGIEFDTWQNGQYGDLVQDHIGMISNGDVSHISGNAIAGPVQAAVGNLNIEDGEDHIVRITWNPETQNVQVFFDCEFRLEATVDLINDIFNGQSDVFWGFTAATGGSFNNQIVCLQDNILNSTEDVIACEGATIGLSVDGDPLGTFEWTPDTYLDDPTAQTPNCTPEQDITYQVVYTDVCGVAAQSEINVSVEALEVDVTIPVGLSCNSPLGTLTGSTNFGQNETWQWSTDDGNFVTGTTASSVVIDSPGTYGLNVNYDDQCSASVEVEITGDFDEPEVSIEGAQTLDCDTPALTLNADIDIENPIINWLDQNANLLGTESTFDVDTPGSFTILIENPENGCVGTDNVQIQSDFTEPDVFAGLPDSLSCQEPVISIEEASVSPSNSVISWTTDTGVILNGSNTLSPEVAAVGNYTLTATDPSNGCTNSAVVFIGEDETATLDLSTFAIPNVFSPNGDNINDRFLPFLIGQEEFSLQPLFERYDLKVFNRWGNMVFDSQGNASAWDGKDDGNELSAGVYYYVLDIRIACGTAVEDTFTGTIEILK